MGRATFVTENNDIYTIIQPSDFSFDDDRAWRLSNGNILHFEERDPVNVVSNLWVMMSTPGGTRYGKLVNIWVSDSQNANWTMCIDREEERAYIIYDEVSSSTGSGGRIKITVLSTIDLSVVAEYDNIIAVGFNHFRILRAIISRTGEIWLLGGETNSQRIYKMNTDGTNVQSVVISPVGTASYNSFALSVDNQAFIFTGGKVLVYDNDLTKIAEVVIEANTAYYALDSFAFNGNVYALHRLDSGTLKLVKYNIDQKTSSSVDLTAIYGITNGVQINTDGYIDDLGESYGTFFQNIGRWWQFKLSDLTCKPLRIENLANKQFVFSDDTEKDIQYMFCDLGFNNCDNAAFLTSATGATGGV